MSEPHYLEMAENRLRSLHGVNVKTSELVDGKRKMTVEGITAEGARKVLQSMGVPDGHIETSEKDSVVTVEVKQ